MKTNNNTQSNERANAIVNNERRIAKAIKAGNHTTREIIKAADMFTEYREFCESIAALQCGGLVESRGDGYYFTEKGEYLTAYGVSEGDEMEEGAAYIVESQTPAEEVENLDECTTAYHHATAARVAHICRTIAEAVGICYASTFPAFDMEQDLNHFAKWQSIAADADDVIDPRAPFYFAVRRQGSESGTREHAAERCRVLGAPVYVVKVEREHNEAGAFLAGRYSLTIATDAAAAELLGLTPDTDPTTPAPADDHQDTDTTTAAEVISESEPTARPAAGSLAAKVATAARVFLLACCLSAADGLTAAPAGSPAADDLTPCELLTADPLAEVIRLQAAGLTVSHVTIKSTTPAAC